VQWLLLVATALVAVLNWWSRIRNDDRLEQITKPLTTVLIIGLALVSGAPASQITIAVVALTFCLVGDIALLPVIDRFVVGLAAFLLGHLSFIVLFARYGLSQWTLGAVAAGLAVALVGFVGRTIISGARSKDAALAMPVIAYLTIICSMTIVGWATGRWLVIIGSTLFVVSDSVLGWRQFVRPRPWMPVAIMVTYHGALVSLALSLW